MDTQRGASQPGEGRRRPLPGAGAPAGAGAPHASAEERERAEDLRALARLLEGADAGAAGLASRFETHESLGSGPFGERFLASDREDHGRAALLLVLDDPRLAPADQLVPRLEELVASELDHPSLVRLSAAGRDARGRAFLASELVEGEDLRALVDAKGALPPRYALEIARQVLAALEGPHARGRAHGALAPETVWLARRVPWSEENPHGVGVRLADFGLAAALGEEVAPGADLAAVGALLGELLTGTRIAPDGSDWPAACTSVRSRALRALIDRALGAAPGRFTSARQFRLEIELTPEWRGTSARAAAWKWVGVTGIVAGITGVALYLGERRGGVHAAARELERTIAALEQEEREGQTEREALNARLAALDRERSELSLRERDGQGEREALAARAAELERSLGTRAGELESARAELAALRLARSSDTLGPTTLAATTLDRLLDHVGARDLGAAARLLEAAQSDATLAPLGFGAGFLESWIEGEQALARAPAAGDAAPDVRTAGALEALVRTREALERAGERRESFVVRSASWIDRPEGGGDERRARIERALVGLRARYDELAAALEPELEARWNALQATSADDPAQVAFLARWKGSGRLADYLARLDRHLVATLEQDGELDLGALEAAPALARWPDVLGTERSSAALDVGFFALARRFAFPADAREGAPPLVPAELGAAEVRGWREELLLRVRALAEDSALPGRAGSRFLHAARSSGGEVSWTLETVRASPGPGAAARWLVEQRFFDAAGRATLARELLLEREGKRVVEVADERRLLADLAASEADVRPYALELGLSVPEGLGVAADDVRRFQDALAARAPRALVLGAEGRETWIVPDLGLVRTRVPGRIERELVFAEVRE